MQSQIETESMEARQVILFVNRKAGTGAGRVLVDEVAQRLEACGYDVHLIVDIDELRKQAAAMRGQVHCVISAGGDGTIEVVVNNVDAGVPIAVFPLGTENLLAKYLQITPDPQRLVEMVSLGRTQRMDVGRVNGKLFLVVLSCGFDADVVRRVHAERKGNITHLAYAKPIIKSMLQFDYPQLKIEWDSDDGWQSQDCHWAFIFNAPRYAAGLKIVPEGDPADGQFEVATFTGGSLWHGLWQFAAVAMGRHFDMSAFQLHRSRRIRISSTQDDVAFQIDGDPGGSLPVEIEVLPQHLTLIVDG